MVRTFAKTGFLWFYFCAFPFFARAQNGTGVIWSYHSTPRFVMAYREEDKLLAIRILDELQQRQRQLAERLGYQPQRVVTVVLCPTQSIFDQMTGGTIPHWGEAAANLAHWRIFLKTPAASNTRELLSVTVTHELAHLCVAELAIPSQTPRAQPNSLPRWFSEGSAILLSGENRHADPTIISRALITKSLVDFEAIDELLSFPSARAGLAYAESYHAVNFMIARFGKEAIRKFAQALGEHAEPRQAFRAAFGTDLWDFEVAYFDYLRQHFRWYFLLDDSFLFGAVILVLLIAGFFITRWRMKKKIEEWKNEEDDANEEPVPPNVDNRHGQESAL
ncbi:MAG: peptidase MA family metallohydrolase [candidate division KSB1 bacterium]|nr:peptidase MA family metallohydrolase [candidate division KSB1 bacterium]MDZ7304823.1 peptidase MA family metallohydrolase [candidate division KSB1 bacterium]MDZ7313903.1 peptidase MA family metallohydrolase [candidate division KSB1 bacterium]